jgi:aryl-alcohol dehydrogenase-like predicted oxidoreductase
MTLEYRQFGQTGLRVSSIGLGCVTFGREIDATTSFDVLDRAVERGVNLFDTAAIYGGGASEEVIGRWLRKRTRVAPIVVATKVSGRLTGEDILRSVDGSLRRMGIERIDLLQAHSWDPETPLEQTMQTFDRLVQEGKVRCCGCSNWSASQLGRAISLADRQKWQRLESVQVAYNLTARELEANLLPLCARQGIGVLAYSPLGAGFLTGKYRRGEGVPMGTRFDVQPGHQDIYFTDANFRIVEGLRRIAARAGCSMAHLALSWVLHRPGITTVLIGARNTEQVDQAFDALRRPHDSIMNELDELSRSDKC